MPPDKMSSEKMQLVKMAPSYNALGHNDKVTNATEIKCNLT